MKPVVFKLLADGIAVLHAAFLWIYLAGAIGVCRGRFSRGQLKLWQYIYLAMVLGMSLTVFVAESCPLTSLENWLRHAGDPTSRYDKSFIENYLPFIPSLLDQMTSVILLALGCVGVSQARWVSAIHSKPR